ncbi:phospholipase B [Kwoniella shandongensis]|uniref:Lysophospholipase n=1 Tax=Kwoniella shandongensis TaxID=1734106 RepID=A0A5M6BUS7_9TREE|nr:phospholipase B [Kwoniella shandongensis]KAA5526618.1 phospholipase B [Kwoniella shandongensis]
MLPLALGVALATTAAIAAPAAPAELDIRALLDTSYKPYQVTCPTDFTWIRNATTGLSSGEQSFIAAREKITSPLISSQLTAHGLTNPPRTPTIGVALAGGGYRAMLTGLGGIMATMNGSSEAAASGLGGWLDGVTYWAGLSGGSWATGSFMANGGPLPIDLITSLWNLDSNLILPDDDKVSFYTELYTETNAKSDAGFPTQLTDLWGLAIASHVLPEQYHIGNNPNLTFSSLPSVVPALGNAALPMPIIIAAEREAGELVIAENATVWEYTPYEFGAWAFGSTTKVAGAFTSLEYLGSELNNGSANGTCWKGFDQMSFIMGSSATLFNGALLQINSSESGLLTDLIKGFLIDLGQDQYDVARIPNSFAHYNQGENPIADLEYITLVDAGETNQNIPIEPLLVPSRNVDAIVAFDSSYDSTYIWPNGTALRTTFERAKILAERTDTQVRMPEVPSENGFINGGYNTRPTFFGCNDTTTPLIIYVPSYPWSYAANTSTYQLEYSNEEATQSMLNGMRSLTLNGTVPTWPKCFACALSDRAFDYSSSNRTADCQECFDTWCWAGDDNTTTPNTYEPVIGSVPPWLITKGLSTGAAPAPGTNTSNGTTSSSSGARRKIECGATWGMFGLILVGVTGMGMVL